MVWVWFFEQAVAPASKIKSSAVNVSELFDPDLFIFDFSCLLVQGMIPDDLPKPIDT
jgi:hypothetical protein